MKTDSLSSPALIEQLLNALETMPDGLIVIDDRGEQLFANTAARKILHSNKSALCPFMKTFSICFLLTR